MIIPGLGDLPVFPCNRVDKSPLIKHGFKSAQRIESPQHWPLVGVPTGEFFDVIDIDEEGLDWLKANPLPATRVHQTPHGFHYLVQRSVLAPETFSANIFSAPAAPSAAC